MINCNLCKNENFTYLFSFNDFNLVKCNNCGLIINNNPMSEEDSKKHYNKIYQGLNGFVSSSIYFSGRDFRLLEAKRRLGRIFKLKKDIKSILDIGCGLGFFLNVANNAEIRAVGTEISENAAQYAKSLGLEVILGDLLEMNDLEQNSFDVVTFWASLEHIYDPKSYLKKVNSLIRNNGLIVIETGDIDSYQAKLFAKEWRLIQKDHNFYFSSANLDKLLSETGFEIIKTEYDGFIESLTSQAGLKDLILNKFKKNDERKRKKYALLKEFLNSKMGELNLGDVMIKYAQKI